MRTVQTMLTVLVMAAASVWAQESAAGSLTGSLMAGYRSVNIDSAGADKYDQHVNLQSGPRLFNLDLSLTPSSALRRFSDRIEVTARNLGGDPFQTLRVSMTKYGAYDLRVERRTSAYFYRDLLLHRDSSNVAVRNAGDLHTFDFQRVHDSGALKLWFGNRLRLRLGYDRRTRTGTATSTMDLERDEFELDSPVEDVGSDLHIALELPLKKLTMVVEERLRSYESRGFRELPAPSTGADTDNLSRLDAYRLDLPVESSSQRHLVRLVLRPGRRLLVTGAASLENLALDYEFDEQGSGTALRGDTLSVTGSGAGSRLRDVASLSLEGSYYLLEKIALVGALRRHTFDQSGSPDTLGRDWRVQNTGARGGIQFQASPALALAAGVEYDRREVERSLPPALAETEGDGAIPATTGEGLFAHLAWRPGKSLRVSADYRSSDYRHPFTATSPTSRRRLRLQARFRSRRGWSFTGSYLDRGITNDESDWRSRWRHLNLTVAYRRRQLEADLAAGLTLVSREINPILRGILPSGELLPPYPQLTHQALYEGSSGQISAALRWLPSRRWSFGANALLYESLGGEDAWQTDTGREVFRPLARLDLGGYAEVAVMGGYRLRGGYRLIRYEEQLRHLNDYRAQLVELSLGHLW
ncbi:MAG: hypothetical protein V3U35_04880 [Candidatus Neomarinimicrobiota bacterium]